MVTPEDGHWSRWPVAMWSSSRANSTQPI